MSLIITLVIALITTFFVIPFGMIPPMYALYGAYLWYVVSGIQMVSSSRETKKG